MVGGSAVARQPTMLMSAWVNRGTSSRRKHPHIADDLAQLLAGINGHVDRGAPAGPPPVGNGVTKRQPQLDVTMLMPRFDPQVAFEGLPGASTVPAAPIPLHLLEKQNQVAEAVRVPVIHGT